MGWQCTEQERACDEPLMSNTQEHTLFFTARKNEHQEGALHCSDVKKLAR